MNSVIRIFLAISLMPLSWLMAEDLKVKVSEQTFTKPAAGMKKTASKMRAAQFPCRARRRRRLNAYFIFGPAGGGAQANLQRWVGRLPGTRSRNLRWMTLRR